MTTDLNIKSLATRILESSFSQRMDTSQEVNTQVAHRLRHGSQRVVLRFLNLSRASWMVMVLRGRLGRCICTLHSLILYSMQLISTHLQQDKM